MEAARDTRIAQPTVSQVLTEFLAEQQARLSARSFARYREVIGLLRSSLNNYASGPLPRRRRTLQLALRCSRR